MLSLSTEHRFTSGEIALYSDKEQKYMKAYSTPLFENGVYKTWNDFLALRKREGVSVAKNKSSLKFIGINRKGKTRFAFTVPDKVAVCEGVPYYQMEHKFCEMRRKGSDFFVTGSITRYRKHFGGTLVGGVMFGMLGVLTVDVLNRPISEMYEFKIHARTGQLIPIKKLSNEEVKASPELKKDN